MFIEETTSDKDKQKNKRIMIKGDRIAIDMHEKTRRLRQNKDRQILNDTITIETDTATTIDR